MAFRFTPPCCCNECKPPCIPSCGEIYRGSGNQNFTPVDLRSTYNKFSGDCLYFKITSNRPADQDSGKTIFDAVPSLKESDENHRLYHITHRTRMVPNLRYECPDVIPEAIYYWPSFAEYSKVYDKTDPNNPIPTATLSSVEVSHYFSITSGDYLQSTNIEVRSVSQLWYDSRYHSPGGVIYTRIICLPFDNIAEPIMLCEDSNTELSPQISKDDYYVPLTGAPGWCDSFTEYLSFTCGMGGQLSPLSTNVFSANKIASEMPIGSWVKPGVDYFVVRLFGWATCPPNREPCIRYDELGVQHIYSSDWRCPPACVQWPTYEVEENFRAEDIEPVSIEFQVSYLERSNHLNELVISSPASTNSVAWDENSEHEKSTVPQELIDYIAKGDAGSIIFGSQDTSALNGTNSVGSSSLMPNCWKISKGKIQNFSYDDLWDINGAQTNDERFHGVYWQLAQISPCGIPFRQSITRGKLTDVPVGEFEVDPSGITDYEDSAYYKTLPARLVKYSHNFSYNDLHKKYYWFTSPGNNNSNAWYYLDDSYQRSNTRRAYIVKPEGFHLVRLIWRVFLGAQYLFTRGLVSSLDPITSDEQLFTLRRPGYSTGYAKPTSPVDDFDSNNYFDIWPNELYWQSDDLGIPIYTRHNLRNPQRDPYGIVENYAQNHGLNIYEKSVNGDTYIHLFDSDLDKEYYMPSMTNQKISELMGVQPSSFNFITNGNVTHAMEYFPNKHSWYLYFQFTYLAVWEPDS